MQKCDHGFKKGPIAGVYVPKTGVLVFGKKVLPFLGHAMPGVYVPKTGFLIF